MYMRRSCDAASWLPSQNQPNYAMIAEHKNFPNYCTSGNFSCKNIFVVSTNHENKIHEIYFTMDIIIASTFLFAQFYSTAS